VLATPRGAAGRIRVGAIAICEALVLGSGAGPRRRVFGHGRRSSRAHRLLRGRHEASGRSEEILTTYVSGSRRDAAEGRGARRVSMIARTAGLGACRVSHDREVGVLATPRGPAGRIRVGAIAICEALVLGNGAGPRRRVFGHGRRSSRAHRLLRGRHEASGRSEEILTSYVSGSRRDAAEVVAYVASR
jgi:hypothetical protein